MNAAAMPSTGGAPLVPSDPARLRQVQAILAFEPSQHDAFERLVALAVRLTAASTAGLAVIGEREVVHVVQVGWEGPVVAPIDDPVFAQVFASGTRAWVRGAEGALGVDEALLVPVCTPVGQVALLWVAARRRDADESLLNDLERVLHLVTREVQHVTNSAAGGALQDVRTSLYNLRGFETLADPLLQLSRRHGEQACVLLVSLDAEGDLGGYVDEFSRLLRVTFRGSDVVARLQGAEFAALAARCDEAAARAIIVRLRDRMSGIRWRGVRLIAGVQVDDGESALEDLLADAVCQTFDERPLRIIT